MNLRIATDADVDGLVSLINAAYEVEQFFVTGDRTDAIDLRSRMQRGQFLLIESEPGAIAGCAFVAVHGRDGFMGMLSVAPARQGHGLGRALAIAAEEYCRSHGCSEIEVEVVNLRTELPPFYRKLGYRESGERPFPDTTRTTRPCHFVVMRKPLMTMGADGGA
jgi:GNAT superfamily N-acetyltransferase